MEKQAENLPQETIAPPPNGTSPGGTDQTCPWSEKELEQHTLHRIVENIEWFNANEDRLRREHPEWDGHFLAVASTTPSKVLAVSKERDVAFDTGLLSPELLTLAAQEGFPPDCFVNSMFLGIDWSF